MARDTNVCPAGLRHKTKASLKADRQGHRLWPPRHLTGITVVLKPAALANNSEPDYPTFFQLRFWLPLSLAKEALQSGMSK